jgi:crotonobetainyl-CoA:carnitine CoA-transferase CaiB-like acyl-CoA transferase
MTVAEAGAGPLAGIRVVDFTWVWSGPMVTYTLADLGAEVIKIEHAGRLDNARLRGRPQRDGRPLEGPEEEVSLYFHQNNRGKLSFAVDVKAPAGAQLVARLIDEADVVIDNLSVGVLERMGLGWDEISRRNPRVTMLAMSAAGQEGPLRSMKAYAPVMTGFSGLESLVGYDDDPVVGMMTIGFGDPNAASHALVALLAALVERERTGVGRFIDMSQIEAVVTVLAEPLATVQLTGSEPDGRALAHASLAPHGHYPCRGEDRWIAIAVASDEEWRGLAAALDLAAAGFATSADRLRRRAELDELIAAATAARERDELFVTLRRAGVRAAPVLTLEEAHADEHLRAREVFTPCDHPITGPDELAAVPWRMSATPPRVRRHAPAVGEHTHDILTRVLRLDEDEIRALEASGVLR